MAIIQFGWSPLIHASMAGHVAIVQYLVQSARADPRICDADGSNALTFAAFHGHGAIVQYLAEVGNVDVNHVNKVG